MEKTATYRVSLFMAIGLHIVLLAFLGIKFATNTHYFISSNSHVHIVNAAVVDQSVVDRQLQQIRAEKERIRQAALEKIRQEKAAAEVKKRAKEEAERQALLKRQEELRINQERARLKAEQAAEARAKASALKKQQQQARLQQAQQAISEQVASEAKQMAAAAEKHEQSIIDRYKALIVHSIAQRWLVPEQLADGISCQLLINLGPGGVVLSVSLVTSSGNAVLDRSAQTAVWKASPLPVPKDSTLFNNFRVLRLTVRPMSE